MAEKIRDIGRVPTYFSKQVHEANRFYLDAHGDTSKRLAVVCGGCEHVDDIYRINRHNFPFHGIEFVARGAGTLTLADKTIPLLPGRVFTYGPGVPHVITSDASDPLVKYFVSSTGREIEPLLVRHDLGPGTVVQVASPEAILRVFEDLVANGSSGSRFAPLICATLVELLVLKIAESTLAEAASQTPAFATYQTCREFIRENYLCFKTLDNIAKACHVDEAYLCRLFKRFDSQSPYQYLMQLKMAVAARRLHYEGKLVKEVAYELGFSDPFHFSRAFKNVFGLSPTTFRKLR